MKGQSLGPNTMPTTFPPNLARLLTPLFDASSRLVIARVPRSSHAIRPLWIAVFPKLWEDANALWSSGAAGAQVPYKHKVGGSNPSSTTMKTKAPAMGLLL